MPARRNRNPTLVLGRAADAEVLLRAIESGAVKNIWPVGILSPSPADRGPEHPRHSGAAAISTISMTSSTIWRSAAPPSRA